MLELHLPPTSLDSVQRPIGGVIPKGGTLFVVYILPFWRLPGSTYPASCSGATLKTTLKGTQ